MGIETKTLGTLVDELCTVSQKLFRTQDDMMSSDSDAEVAKHAKRAQEINVIRNKLIRAIDSLDNNVNNSLTEKTYDKGGSN